MTKLPPYSTWGQAYFLWMWTNLAGTLGCFISLLFVPLGTDSRYQRPETLFSGALLIGFIAAIASLPAIPLAYRAFAHLLRIPRFWPRLGWTLAATVGAFGAVLLLAVGTVLGPGSSLNGILALGGWAYLLAALGLSAAVYSEALFRPDDTRAA